MVRLGCLWTQFHGLLLRAFASEQSLLLKFECAMTKPSTRCELTPAARLLKCLTNCGRAMTSGSVQLPGHSFSHRPRRRRHATVWLRCFYSARFAMHELLRWRFEKSQRLPGWNCLRLQGRVRLRGVHLGGCQLRNSVGLVAVTSCHDPVYLEVSARSRRQRKVKLSREPK